MKSAVELQPKASPFARLRELLAQSTAGMFSDQGTLRQKVFRSGFWVLLGQGCKQLGGVLRVVILARLLAPEDFGLMGIALVTLGFLETFAETGYQSALVQRTGDIQPYLNSVFTVQVLRGLALGLILLTGAPWAGSFFKNPEAVPLVQSVALIVVFRGLINPGVVVLQRELNFRKQFIWNITEFGTGLILAIGLGFWLRNAWALVLSSIGATAVQAAMSYVVAPIRPGFGWRWPLIRELSQFGKWMMGLNCIVYLSLNLDNVAVGRILGTAALGFYQVAYRIANLPATEISKVASIVAFPVYAQLQEDRTRTERFFFANLAVVVLAGLPLVFVCVFLGEPLVKLVLGEKWLPAVSILQVLSLYGQLRMLSAVGGPLFQGLGRPAYDTKMNLIRLFVLAALIFPLTTRWGAVGAAWAAVASVAATLPYWLRRCAECLMIRTGPILRRLGLLTAQVVLGLAIPLLLCVWILPTSRWSGLGVALGVASISYAAVLLTLWRNGIMPPRLS